MTKSKKLEIFFTVTIIIALVAFAADIIFSIRQSRPINFLAYGAVFSALTIAVTSLNCKKENENN